MHLVTPPPSCKLKTGPSTLCTVCILVLLQNWTKYFCTVYVAYLCPLNKVKFQHFEMQTMHISGTLRLAADVFRRRVRRRSLQPPLAVAATSPFPSIRLLASCWASCVENDPQPLGAFHGSRSVPRPPRHCVFPRSRATGCPVAVAVGAARNL